MPEDAYDVTYQLIIQREDDEPVNNIDTLMPYVNNVSTELYDGL
jgi:hypothetical protein